MCRQHCRTSGSCLHFEVPQSEEEMQAILAEEEMDICSNYKKHPSDSRPSPTKEERAANIIQVWEQEEDW